MPRVTYVLMAGGKGERLWPLVRQQLPKVCLSPDGRRTLLSMAVDRLRGVWPMADWRIVITKGQEQAVARTLPASLRRAILVEPTIKNTAACITLAALDVAARDPSRVLVFAPADHWIGDIARFRQTLRQAIRAAAAHQTIVTVGLQPTHAHPGLGYLCAGASVGRGTPRVRRLERFVEKPSAVLAQRLIRRPGTLWNSGMFIGTAECFLRGVAEWLPDHAQRLVRLLRPGRGVSAGGAAARAAYRSVQPVSFDHGVMQHLRGGLVVEGRFPWEDLGSWDVWARLGAPSARVVHVDSHEVAVVGSPEHLVATIGLRGLVVIHTPTATLICPPGRAQAVRDVVRQLRANRRLRTYL